MTAQLKSVAFGRHRVAAHGIDLGDQGHAQARIRLGDGDRGAQAGAAGTDNGDIGLDHLHHLRATGLSVTPRR